MCRSLRAVNLHFTEYRVSLSLISRVLNVTWRVTLSRGTISCLSGGRLSTNHQHVELPVCQAEIPCYIFQWLCWLSASKNYRPRDISISHTSTKSKLLHTVLQGRMILKLLGFLDSARRLVFQKTQRFWNWISFRPDVKSCLVCPQFCQLERAIFKLWACYILSQCC
jgi:hypothetical protein